jgi:hypothetical protein
MSPPGLKEERNGTLRSAQRSRRYVTRHWLFILRPVLRYSATRDAFVLRGVGSSIGPVLRPDRRSRRSQPFDEMNRRRAGAA